MIKNSLYTFGKWFDQPGLIKALNKKMPVMLTVGALSLGLYDTFKTEKEQRNKKLIKNISILSLTVSSALFATRGLKLFGKQIFEGIGHVHNCKHGVNEVLKTLKKDNLSNSNLIKSIEKIRDDKYISLKEVKNIKANLENIFGNKKAIDKVITTPHTHGFKDSIKEMLHLSYIGLVPVIGGISGGIIGDFLTEKKWKEKVPDKIKEGFYQYASNIFLCNVGAGSALGLMELLNVQSKGKKLLAAMSGVLGVGILGGSQIANYIGKKVINPIFERPPNIKPESYHNHSKLNSIKHLNDERHPEMLDVSLHLDDIASIGFLSGLKWIAPALPLFYSISAYRSGIGYRNGHSHKNK
ncbi:MAG: hypothetical protein PHV68_00775 [Candidatus Gastranaerophilales bacterium]|nr:hypothetical protein [Candidatus Gastranaerophilales bacterium]